MRAQVSVATCRATRSSLISGIPVAITGDIFQLRTRYEE
jgi:hypothetical protein